MSYESKPFGFALSSSRQTSPEPGATNAEGGGGPPRRMHSTGSAHSLGAAGYHASAMPDLSSFFSQPGKSGGASVGSPYGSHGTPPGSALTPGTSSNANALYASFMSGTSPQSQGQVPRSPFNPYMQSMLGRSVASQQQQQQQMPPGAMSSFQQQYYQAQQPVMQWNETMQAEPSTQAAGPSKGDSPLEDDEDEDEDEEDESGDDGQGSDFAGEEETSKKRRRSGVRAGNNKRNKVSDEPATTQNGGPSTKKSKAKQKDGSADPEAKSNNRSTRGSKACTVCRRLKMRCEPTGNPDDTKCKRCKNGNHDCIFEESQRGRRKNQKADAMARSIKNMENTLETVLKSIAAGNANMIAGMTLGSDGHLVPGAADLLQQLGPQQQQQLQMPQNGMPMMPPHLQQQDIPIQQIPQEITPMTASVPLPPLPLPNSVLDMANGNSNGPQASPGTDSSATQSRMAAIKAEELPTTSPAVRLHTLPEPENTWAPLGLLAEASLENSHSRAKRTDGETAREESDSGSMRRNADGEEEKKIGVANDAYFQPGPSQDMQSHISRLGKNLPSPLLTDGIITIEEAIHLFNLYHEHCSMHTGHFLLEDWHTPMNVSSRSTFLFTAICAVASKFYALRPELYGLCMPYARNLASEMISKGYKSIEIVQAYLLLCFYNTPSERFEDDRTWTYSGLAIRMAVEMALWRNPKPPPDLDGEALNNFAMEVANRERTWVYISVTDRSISTQTGRPPTLRLGEFERNIQEWATSEPVRPSDAGVAAILALYNVTSNFQDLVGLSCFATGRASLQDYGIVMKGFENSLNSWDIEWTRITIQHGGDLTSRGNTYRALMKEFYMHWHRLLAYSYALQQILKLSPSTLEIMPFFLPCYQSATKLLEIAREKLHPLGYLKYAQDLVFVYISYASVFLLKLLRPELADCTDTEAILTEVEASVKCLEEVSVDETHTPALYAGFVRVLLHSKQSKPQNGDGVVTLDPALTSKLLESQQSGRVADAFNAAPVGDMISSINEPIASQHQMEPSASVYQHTFTQEPQSGYHSGESNLHQWNLDQLGQSGFWENLSMPGLGSPPTYGLSGGHLFQGDPWPFSMPNSAAPSRTTSPRLGASGLSSYTIPNLSSL